MTVQIAGVASTPFGKHPDSSTRELFTDAALEALEELYAGNFIGEVTDALANAADNEYENEAGLTFPGIYALMAQTYMNSFDVTQEDLAAVTVKNLPIRSLSVRRRLTSRASSSRHRLRRR